MKRIYGGIVALLLFLPTSGCALGAATAGVAIRAETANSLTPAGEQRIVDRVKAEIKSELRAMEIKP